MNSEQLIGLLRSKLEELNVTLLQFVNYDLSDAEISELEATLGTWGESDRERIYPDEYLYVMHFNMHNIYIAFNGDYSSWSGTDFSGTVPYEVVKATKTVEYWKAI